MNRLLFTCADFLGRPPGFYFVIGLMVVSTMLAPLGLTNEVTFALSVAAIVITGIVLIQGYRDTAAIHAKLDEIILSQRDARNEIVGLEHEDVETIRQTVAEIEQQAGGRSE